jgi:hypothetical protein
MLSRIEKHLDSVVYQPYSGYIPYQIHNGFQLNIHAICEGNINLNNTFIYQGDQVLCIVYNEPRKPYMLFYGNDCVGSAWLIDGDHTSLLDSRYEYYNLAVDHGFIYIDGIENGTRRQEWILQLHGGFVLNR